MKRPVDIPCDWTPAQAATVLDFLETVSISIWLMYADDLSGRDPPWMWTEDTESEPDELDDCF